MLGLKSNNHFKYPNEPILSYINLFDDPIYTFIHKFYLENDMILKFYEKKLEKIKLIRKFSAKLLDILKKNIIKLSYSNDRSNIYLILCNIMTISPKITRNILINLDKTFIIIKKNYKN